MLRRCSLGKCLVNREFDGAGNQIFKNFARTGFKQKLSTLIPHPSALRALKGQQLQNIRLLHQSRNKLGIDYKNFFVNRGREFLHGDFRNRLGGGGSDDFVFTGEGRNDLSIFKSSDSFRGFFTNSYKFCYPYSGMDSV